MTLTFHRHRGGAVRCLLLGITLAGVLASGQDAAPTAHAALLPAAGRLTLRVPGMHGDTTCPMCNRSGYRALALARR